MLETGGHWGRHYQAAKAGNCRMTIWDKIRDWARWYVLGREIREGRRRIIPGMPIDNHAAGWQRALTKKEGK